MRPRLLIRKIHKWLGLILGIQILLWFFSGFLMSFMPIEEIRGNHLMQKQTTADVSLQPINLGLLKSQIAEPVVSVEIKSWLGRTVAEVTTPNQSILFDATDMQALTPIGRAEVQQIISQNLLPEYKIESINYLTEPPTETRGRKGPLWQVKMSGGEDPHIYISAQTGEIVAVRTNRWRLFDFLWMLHIMDYDERSDFNHPLLYLTALSAFLFTITGFVLVYFGFKPARKKRH